MSHALGAIRRVGQRALPLARVYGNAPSASRTTVLSHNAELPNAPRVALFSSDGGESHGEDATPGVSTSTTSNTTSSSGQSAATKARRRNTNALRFDRQDPDAVISAMMAEFAAGLDVAPPQQLPVEPEKKLRVKRRRRIAKILSNVPTEDGDTVSLLTPKEEAAAVKDESTPSAASTKPRSKAAVSDEAFVVTAWSHVLGDKGAVAEEAEDVEQVVSTAETVDAREFDPSTVTHYRPLPATVQAGELDADLPQPAYDPLLRDEFGRDDDPAERYSSLIDWGLDVESEAVTRVKKSPLESALEGMKQTLFDWGLPSSSSSSRNGDMSSAMQSNSHSALAPKKPESYSIQDIYDMRDEICDLVDDGRIADGVDLLHTLHRARRANVATYSAVMQAAVRNDKIDDACHVADLMVNTRYLDRTWKYANAVCDSVLAVLETPHKIGGEFPFDEIRQLYNIVHPRVSQSAEMENVDTLLTSAERLISTWGNETMTERDKTLATGRVIRDALACDRPDIAHRFLSRHLAVVGTLPDPDEYLAIIEGYLQKGMMQEGYELRVDFGRAFSDSLDPPLIKQLDSETRSVDDAVERYRESIDNMMTSGMGANINTVHAVLVSWYKPLMAGISAEQRRIRENVPGMDRQAYGHYLTLLGPEKLAVIALHETLGLLLNAPPSGLPFARVALNIGRSVQTEVNLARMKNDRSLPNTKVLTRRSVSRHARRALEDAEWPQAAHAKIGSVLLDIIMKTAAVPSDHLPADERRFRNYPSFEVDQTSDDPEGASYNPEPISTAQASQARERADVEEHPVRPAFRHVMIVSRLRKQGYLQADETVFRTVGEGEDLRAIVTPRFRPMLVQPRPWTRTSQGGYLSLKSYIMRTRGSHEQSRVLREGFGGMDQVKSALDVLGATPWQINSDVLRVVEEVWKTGGGVAEIPLVENLPIPPRPDDMESDHSVRRQYWKSLTKVATTNRNRHSLRCSFKYQLQVARDFEHTTMYFPHNMDFRGRAYPIPPHLNHVGSDFCRGLLLFDQGKPLGPNGLDWLKIHLANLIGKDKLDFDDRIRYIDDHLADVYASADDPLSDHGRELWVNADEPWQALASCMDLARAIRSGDPENYVSRLPVHQDGSCNGLQHYAALGRDLVGARSVDIVPADKPQDVYSNVADILKQRVYAKADEGHEMAIKVRDAGWIDRKLIKQTVMTSVYGVTFIGAKEQISNRLREREIDDDDVQPVAMFLAAETMDAMGNLFTGAREIMAWLAQCARVVAHRDRPVMWTTPLGLPVVQPYRRLGRHSQVRTLVQAITVVDRQDNLPVSTQRQQSAFPPNYVHSLDSSHMMLTALSCHRAGLTFASVHDSYWTHAGTIETMNGVIRDEFVNLYERPLLENLLAELQQRYPTAEFPPVPNRGALDLHEVKKSKYFFD